MTKAQQDVWAAAFGAEFVHLLRMMSPETDADPVKREEYLKAIGAMSQRTALEAADRCRGYAPVDA